MNIGGTRISLKGLAAAAAIIAGPLLASPASAQFGGFGGTTGITLTIGEWVPAWDGYGGWGVIPAGGDPAAVQWTRDVTTLQLPAGNYDVYWIQDFDTREAPMRLATNVAVGAGLVTVPANQGVQLEIAEWVPARDPEWGWWGAFPAGAGPEGEPVNWSHRAEALLLPPGQYDIYWAQEFLTRDDPMLIAAAVDIAAGAAVPIAANTGVILDVGDWVPERDREYGWWGAVAAGSDPAAPVNWTRTAEALLLPPGDYDIYWVQDFLTRDTPMRIATGTIGPSELGRVEATTGIRIEVAEWVPARDPEYGWWGAVGAGGTPDANLVNWTRTADALLLPPGEYDVYWVQDFARRDQPVLLARSVPLLDPGLGILGVQFSLDPDGLRVVAVLPGSPAEQAGIVAGDILFAAAGVPLQGLTLEEAALRLRGAPGSIVDLSIRRAGTANFVVLKITRAVADPVRVVHANSGIRAVPAADVAPLEAQGWWGAVPAGGAAADRVNWAVGTVAEPLLLAPGVYDIYWSPAGGAPELKAAGVEVAPGAVIDVTIGLASIPASVVAVFGVQSNEAPNAGTAFPQGTREIQAQYAWQNATVGFPLGVRWYLGDQLILEQGEPVPTANGETNWTLRMLNGEPLPAGNYRVDLVEPNRPPRGVAFTVGAP